MSTPTRINIRPGSGPPYDVVVGHGLADAVEAAVAGRSALLIHPVALTEYATGLMARLRETGRSVAAACVPDGESAKQLATLEELFSSAAAAGLDRAGVVIGCGGGAVTDVAGFLAATWLRGVDLIQLPTTLLAMVDAAIGGKTAVNVAAGKNLVGVFHQPRLVLCDLDRLASLPRTELVSGLAEVIKCGFIADPNLLELATRVEHEPRLLRDAVEGSVRVKAAVVSADVHESGQREILNYGHTLGHALEAAGNYRLRHGEAVSLGMVFAAELAWRAGRCTHDLVEQHRSVLHAAGLPVRYTGELGWAELAGFLRRDKKVRHGRLRFIVLDGLARPGVLEEPDPQLLAASFAAVLG